MDFICNVSSTIIEWHIEMAIFWFDKQGTCILIRSDTFISMNLCLFTDSQETNNAARKFLI